MVKMRSCEVCDIVSNQITVAHLCIDSSQFSQALEDMLSQEEFERAQDIMRTVVTELSLLHKLLTEKEGAPSASYKKPLETQCERCADAAQVHLCLACYAATIDATQ